MTRVNDALLPVMTTNPPPSRGRRDVHPSPADGNGAAHKELWTVIEESDRQVMGSNRGMYAMVYYGLEYLMSSKHTDFMLCTWLLNYSDLFI